MKNTRWVALFLAIVLLSSCGHDRIKVNDTLYLFPNYSFADSTLERLVSEAVEAMDVPDSVLILVDLDFVPEYNIEGGGDGTFDTLVFDDILEEVSYSYRQNRLSVTTFHPEYHCGADNRAYLERMGCVAKVAGHKCLILDGVRYMIYSSSFKELSSWTPVFVKDSLSEGDKGIYGEKEHHFFFDTLGRVVRDSTAVNSTSVMFFDHTFTVVENAPQFPGGLDSLQAFVERNLRNPRQVEGKVFVQFVVERDGRLTDITVKKGIDEETDEEALRVLRMMPRWEPGRQRDRLVRVSYFYAVRFKPTEK